jgi:hypothetical protein
LTPQRIRKLEDPFGAKIDCSILVVACAILGYSLSETF